MAEEYEVLFLLTYMMLYYGVLCTKEFDFRVWCLSRQLWWGHRLPLYKVGDDWVAARSPHEAKVKYAAKHGKMCEEVQQENDVLDTWFSSALLPFTVFGWPTVRK